MDPIQERHRVFGDIDRERERQIVKWGPQHHPDGTDERYGNMRDDYRTLCNRKHDLGLGTWLDILLEETYEAAAEMERHLLRRELVQCAAVIVAWIEDIDSRHG